MGIKPTTFELCCVCTIAGLQQLPDLFEICSIWKGLTWKHLIQAYITHQNKPRFQMKTSPVFWNIKTWSIFPFKLLEPLERKKPFYIKTEVKAFSVPTQLNLNEKKWLLCVLIFSCVSWGFNWLSVSRHSRSPNNLITSSLTFFLIYYNLFDSILGNVFLLVTRKAEWLSLIPETILLSLF